MPDPPLRVVTEHDDANQAIDTLRQIATVLKQVGDENVYLQEQVENAEEAVQAAERVAERLDGIAELVEDYGRGIIDRDELLAKVKERRRDD